ncbi:PBZ domain/Uncharacterized conserved protein (DUF2228) [Lotmaria passim]
MAAFLPTRLPVCAYDGYCYRKNPQHFQQYAHPLQYPQPAPDTASTNPAEEPPTPPPSTKRCRCEETHSRSASPSASQHGDKTPVSTVSETDLASPEQLLYFLKHAPHLSTLVSGHNTGDVAEEPASDNHNTDDDDAQSTNDMNKKKSGSTCAVPHVDVHHHWQGVAQVLQRAYSGMRFHAVDMQCLLTAASALQPSDPLTAFPGWRLVGPFELALTYAQLRCNDDNNCANADAAAAVRKREELLRGRDAEDEVRRWKCGRFRYDPPECQTIVVQVTQFNTPNTGAAAAAKAMKPVELSVDGVHLCFHRDNPTDTPDMLVEGTTRGATFTMINGRGWLSPYLYAWYRAKGDAASLAVAAALENAVHAVAAHTPPVARAAFEGEFQKSLKAQYSDFANRRKAWTAPTCSRLGICVPVDKKTKIGYREPNIPHGVSFADCLRNCEAGFVAGLDSSSFAAGSHALDNSGAAGALDAVPFSRSSRHAQLQEVRRFSSKTSDVLDSIFVCADIANDEGDFGTSLELGLNSLTCVLADRCVVVAAATAEKHTASQKNGANGGDDSDRSTPLSKACRAEMPRIDPVLWHTYRLLDCAYMLLQRPLYRHVLRCHLPLLADATHPISLDV